MITIRGATSINEDSEQEIENKTVELFDEIIKANDIKHIESIIFSVTPDIRALNPSTVVRKKYSLDDVSFMTFQEATFANSEKSIIRIMIFCESSSKNFVYLHDARKLRTK